MAPGSLCFHEGRLESIRGAWAGERDIYSCCTCPPRAPAPVPGTCHPAFSGDSIGIRKSWWAGPRSAPEGIMGRPGPPLRPGPPCSTLLVEKGLLGWFQGSFWPDRLMMMGKIGEGRVTASKKKEFFQMFSLGCEG